MKYEDGDDSKKLVMPSVAAVVHVTGFMIVAMGMVAEVVLLLCSDGNL